MNIYVENISRTANEQDLKDAFAAFGEVPCSSIIKDKFSGESRGFGFVFTLYSQPRADAPKGESPLFFAPPFEGFLGRRSAAVRAEQGLMSLREIALMML
jgi:hypothetical protein